jgi:hypothetical protein
MHSGRFRARPPSENPKGRAIEARRDLQEEIGVGHGNGHWGERCRCWLVVQHECSDQVTEEEYAGELRRKVQGADDEGDSNNAGVPSESLGESTAHALDLSISGAAVKVGGLGGYGRECCAHGIHDDEMMWS